MNSEIYKTPLAMRADPGPNTLEIVQHCNGYSRRIYLLDIAAVLEAARDGSDDHVGFSVELNGQAAQLNDTEFSFSVATPQPITPVQVAMAAVSMSSGGSPSGSSESGS